MTKREFYTAVSQNENVTEEIRTHAIETIEKMDAAALKAKSQPRVRKVNEENEALKASMIELIGESKMSTSEVAAALDIKTQKASALLRQLVADDKLVDTEDKDAVSKRKVKFYSMV